MIDASIGNYSGYGSSGMFDTYFAITIVVGILLFILFTILCLSNLSISSRLKEISDAYYKANKDKIDGAKQEQFKEDVSSLKYQLQKEETNSNSNTDNQEQQNA